MIISLLVQFEWFGLRQISRVKITNNFLSIIQFYSRQPLGVVLCVLISKLDNLV